MSPRQGKKHFFLLCLFVAITIPVFAQQDVADSLKRTLGFINDSNKVDQLLKLTDAYFKYAPKKALETGEEARALSVQIGNERLEAKSLQVLGRVNFKIGKPNEALEFFSAA